MGLLGRLFGSDDAITSLVDNASNGIDKLFYTEEEKAEDKAKSASEARSMVIDWLKCTQGQNLARRLIALIVTFIWVLQYVAMMTLSTLAVWVESADTSKKMVESSNIIGGYAESMNGAMMLILGFYFAAPHMGKMAEAAINKFGSKLNK